jgi:hypothetical protein
LGSSRPAGAAIAPGGSAIAANQGHPTSFFQPFSGAHAPASCVGLITFPAVLWWDDANGVSHLTLNNNGGWGGNASTGDGRSPC